jgi:hypothetical protein
MRRVFAAQAVGLSSSLKAKDGHHHRILASKFEKKIMALDMSIIFLTSKYVFIRLTISEGFINKQ